MLCMPRIRGSAILAALSSALHGLQEQAAFRVYITDALYAMGDNKRMTQRYADLIKPRKVDRRSADEIADDIIRRCGLKKRGEADERI